VNCEKNLCIWDEINNLLIPVQYIYSKRNFMIASLSQSECLDKKAGKTNLVVIFDKVMGDYPSFGNHTPY